MSASCLAVKNKYSQKVVSTKVELVKCVAKSTIVTNIHTWRFCVKKLQNEALMINVMQRHGIELYEAKGQAKWLMVPIPGVNNG